MKKLTALFLSLLSVFSLAACGADDLTELTVVTTAPEPETIQVETDAQPADYDAAEDADVSSSTYSEGGGDSYWVEYTFRNDDRLQEHYEKHGIEMGYASSEDYAYNACYVANDPNALCKQRSDGDYCYYLEESNEFVVVSEDGYLRTYFCPDAGKAYYDRQER